MIKLSRLFLLFLFIGSIFFSSCQKESAVDAIISNDAVHQRLAYTEKGYVEIEVNPIVKIECYFPNWSKEVITPVSGLFEYYDNDENWVASIDFGNGSCDEWATKTWDINVFPDYPSGADTFSVFEEYKDKE